MLAQDDTPGIEPVLHAIKNLSNVENILLLQPTSPLRRTFDIDEIFKIISKYQSDSSVSVTLAKKNIDLFFAIDDNKRLNSFSEKLKFLPRQKYPKTYILNGSLYLSSIDSIFQNNSFISSNTVGYIMPEEFSIDIDTQLDWEIAEFLMTQKL